jgi:hypothetical protein
VSRPQRHPLAWPPGRPRTKVRRRGDFKSGERRITLEAAADRLDLEIGRLGGIYPLLSSNMELRLDGRPRADRGQPADPGVCVYFRLKDQPIALACDTFTEVAQNIAAIANHIDAMRRQERYGVATAAEMLRAFVALPAPEQPARPWNEVFGVMAEAATEEHITTLYRVLAKRVAHDEAKLAELNVARDQALAAIRAGVDA